MMDDGLHDMMDDGADDRWKAEVQGVTGYKKDVRIGNESICMSSVGMCSVGMCSVGM